MNTYEKLTLEKFKANLDANKYQNITGARRAIGKADWSEADKDKGRTLAEKFFGETGGSKTKTSKKGVVKAEKKQTTASASTRPKNVHSELKSISKEALQLDDLTVSREIISSCAIALDALTRAKACEPRLDITEAQIAVDLIIRAAEKMHEIIGSKAVKPATSTTSIATETVFQTNGSSEMQEDPLFARPSSTLAD